MKKMLMMLFLLLAVAATGFAQTGKKSASKTDLTAKVPVDKKVRIGHLDNGFTYYIRANKKPENRVQFRLVTNAGSVLEDDDQQGLAHFCEHMAFNGTQHYKGNDMISTLQQNGIEFGRGINAWTSFDETVYYVELPSDNKDMLEMGFKILDGWAGKLLFDSEEIEKERGVILEEWRGGLGANERLRKATFPIILKDSKYADRLPIGLEEVIRTFKRETIVRFYTDWYRPDLQAIVIVGDINVDEMEAKVKEYFAGYAKRVNPRPRPTMDVPGNKEPLIAIATDKEATGTSLSLMWKHKKAPQGTVGDYRQALIRQLCNGMINSRFADMAEKPTAPFLYAGGSYGSFLGRECDAFDLSAMPKENRSEEAVEMLLTEMKRLDQHGFLQTELDRQKEDLLSNYLKMAKEENKTQNNNFAQEYTNNFLEGEVIPGIRQEYKYAKEFMDDITVEECNAMVAGWVTDENFVYYMTAPDKKDVKVPTEKAILKILKKVKKAKTTPWVDNYKDEPLYAKELPAAKANVSKTNEALGYTEYTLPNGIRFVVKKTDYKADEIRMMSYGLGGTSLYNDNEFLTATMADGLVDAAGIAGFSATQLQKKLQGKNLAISPYVDELNQGFNGSCSPKDLETLLQLLNLYYEAPRKDKDAFDKNMETYRTQFKFVGENPQVVFMVRFNEECYNKNPRQILIPSMEQLNAITLDRTYEIFRERFADASNQTFFFVGNISDEDIALISKYLNNLPVNGRQKNEMWQNRAPHLAAGVNRVEVLKGTDNQGMMVIQGETEGFEATPQNRLIANALSEALAINAIEIIREEMGGTYSPSVAADYDILPVSKFTWMFSINCDPEKSAEIEKAALDILRDYIAKGPNAETLAKVKEQMIRNRQTSMQENGFWMGQIYGSYYYNESRDEAVKNYENNVNSITIEQIRDMAAKYIDLNHYTIGFLKPETK